MNDLGLHFAIGLEPSPSLTDHDKHLLEALRPAGVTLFRGNFAHGEPYEVWLAKLRALVADVRGCIQRERILVCIDHEGGRVVRTPPPITHFAYAREWASQAGAVGRAMAIELRSLGFNVDFAPVVDVHSNPDNPVIGPRSFGTDPEHVIDAALAFMKAMEAEGVMTCPKHFPGHGDTAVDSHHGLPVVSHNLKELRKRELVPFKAAIDAGARLIMTSHILFPVIDEAVPATMSRRIIHDILRDDLGFDGVVVTDDIGMGAVRDMFDRAETAEQIMNAGTDIIDICAYGTDTAAALRIASFIEDGVNGGRIDRKTVEKSQMRVARLLEAAPQHDVEALAPEVFEAHALLAPLHDAAMQGAGTWQPKS